MIKPVLIAAIFTTVSGVIPYQIYIGKSQRAAASQECFLVSSLAPSNPSLYREHVRERLIDLLDNVEGDIEKAADYLEKSSCEAEQIAGILNLDLPTTLPKSNLSTWAHILRVFHRRETDGGSR